MSSCRACCRALSWRALLVGCSSLEDDLLKSFKGMSSLGLGWQCFFQMDWISPVSDSVSVSSCVPKMWLMPVRVFCLSLPSDAAWPLLKSSASPLPASASSSSSSQGASSSLWESSDSLLVSWLSSVAWDWAEPDRRLWREVILQAWLHDQALEPRGPPNPAELLETAGDGGWSTPSLCWWATLPNTLVRVQDALTFYGGGEPHLFGGTIFCKQRTPGNRQ